MNRANLQKIESESVFVELLEKHNLFREDDVTFDDLGENIYVYSGDDFRVDSDILAEMEVTALLVDGSIRAEFISVSDILDDFGVFCVTGDLRCKDMLYMTESTGMVVGGSLVVENIFYSDCGNSVLQVNKDLDAKLFFNSQCSVDVRGRTNVELDENAGPEQLKSLGLFVSGDSSTHEVVRAYFDRYSK